MVQAHPNAPDPTRPPELAFPNRPIESWRAGARPPGERDFDHLLHFDRVLRPDEVRAIRNGALLSFDPFPWKRRSLKERLLTVAGAAAAGGALGYFLPLIFR